ncbi:MAG: riboflavin kinase [Lachnospiraceae bacterium]|nr:riboflavin kinase [Lachnospiraceae bacterium]
MALYVLNGEVVHGRGIGGKAGMPTANLKITKDMDMPPLGVYASKIFIDDKEYIGITNVGLRPTVDSDDDISIETYIIDFDGDIYGKDVRLEIYLLLRGQQKFENIEMLRRQLMKDAQKALEYFG